MKLVTEEQIREYTDFAVAHERSHTLQSYEWGLVKSNWVNEYVLVRDDAGKIKASMSILLRKTPLFRLYYMYAPRGPICDLHDKESLKALIEGAAEIAKKYNGIALKIDTDAPASDTEYAQNMKELGFKLRNDYTNLEGVQARFVFRIDIKDKTPEQVMANFHRTTRYNVKLAERRGVEIKVGGREDIPVFYKLMVETGKRDGFVVRNIDYFYKIYDCLGPKYQRLFLAYYNGVPLAGSIGTLYGSKCLYLYGGSTDQYRQLKAPALIQWAMIRWAIENKCRYYDLMGVPGNIEDESNPLYGLYKFKRGFGGDLWEFVGEFDMVYKPFWNWCFNAAEHSRKSLRRFVSRAKVMLRRKTSKERPDSAAENKSDTAEN